MAPIGSQDQWRVAAPEMIEKVRFAADSPLEGTSFEPTVVADRTSIYSDDRHMIYAAPRRRDE
jgi:hypothetical protein